MNTVDPNRPTNWSSLVRAGGVATLGGLLFGSDTAVISGAIEPLRVFFNLDRGMKGWAAACALVGPTVAWFLPGSVALAVRRFSQAGLGFG